MSADELDPHDVEARVADGWLLVDVRTPGERDAGYIPGSVHVELDRLPAEAASLPRDRGVIFYCRVGARSAMATEAFRAAGREAANLRGGILAWAEAGLPLEPDGGRVAPH